MNPIKCMIVDDEPVAQRILKGYLAELSEFDLVGICNNALEAKKMLNTQAVDLMFLDIEMPKLKGLDFIKMLSDPPQVVITTAHREFALDGFELEVLDYLLKPISFDRFYKACLRYQKLFSTSKMEAKVTSQERNFLYAKSNRKVAKIPINDILYLEGMSNYVKVVCANQTFIVYHSLSGMLKELPNDFLRIHKSYIVNRQKVSFFSKDQVEINDIQLPIGKTFQENIDEKI